MNNTVKWALISLNLNTYSHVSIRRHLNNDMVYLGGGSVATVLSRFGNEQIEDSCIVDNVLVIYVR